MKTEPTVHMPADELLFVGKAASLFTPDFDIVVYGSRARGDHRSYSDVDIAVFGAPEPFDIDVTRLYAVLNNSSMTLQPKVVQIDQHKAAEFVKNVLQDGVLVYEGCGAFRKRRIAAGYTTATQPVFSPANPIFTAS